MKVLVHHRVTETLRTQRKQTNYLSRRVSSFYLHGKEVLRLCADIIAERHGNERIPTLFFRLWQRRPSVDSFVGCQVIRAAPETRYQLEDNRRRDTTHGLAFTREWL